MKTEELIPLFPLSLVLFPQMPLPLHIFEERYREMTRHCLEQEQVFGVVLHNEGGYCKTGCTARIVEVMRKYDDGRMDILAEGVDRFLIEDVSEDAAYLQASVRYFKDKTTKQKAADAGLRESGRKFLIKLFKEAGQKIDPVEFEQLSAKQISFLIASFGGYTMPEKQTFLEMTSTVERLQEELALKSTVLGRMAESNKIEKAIQSNGHVPGLKLGE